MNRTPAIVTLGGLAVRVTPCGSQEETVAVAECVNARLKELEATSHKVDTQAYALQAAYDFARQLAELRARVKDEESQTTRAVEDLVRQVEVFRDRIEHAADSGEDSNPDAHT